ncbi:transposase [Scytonema sp. HK-05]|nr:transposase [Scytonema sp. HK-05]
MELAIVWVIVERQDLAAMITSFCARLYGLRRAKRKTEKLIAELQAQADE